MTTIDEVGFRAATSAIDDASRDVDVDAGLARLLADTSSRGAPGSRRRTGVLLGAVAVTVVVAVAVAIVAIGGSEEPRRITPVAPDTTARPPTLAPTTAPPTTITEPTIATPGLIWPDRPTAPVIDPAAMPAGTRVIASVRNDRPGGVTPPSSEITATYIARYSPDRSRAEAVVVASHRAADGAPAGNPNAEVRGNPAWLAEHEVVWIERGRLVSVGRQPGSTVDLVAIAAGIIPRGDGGFDVVGLPAGFEVAEEEPAALGSSGVNWATLYAGTGSTDVDEPVIRIDLDEQGAHPAEHELLTYSRSGYAVDIDGTRVIVVASNGFRGRQVDLVWDGPDGSQTRLQYKPRTVVTTTDDLADEALTMVRSMIRPSAQEWADVQTLAAANAADLARRSWLTDGLAANGMVPDDQPVATPTALGPWIVPAQRTSDGAPFVCEFHLTVLLGCRPTSAAVGTAAAPKASPMPGGFVRIEVGPDVATVNIERGDGGSSRGTLQPLTTTPDSRQVTYLTIDSLSDTEGTCGVLLDAAGTQIGALPLDEPGCGP